MAVRKPCLRSIGTVVAIGFLLLQLTMVVRARFVDARSFSWAPYTTQVDYWLEVEVAGRRLSDDEVSSRYRLWLWGFGRESHGAQDLIDVIDQYERTYGRWDDARVRLEYSVNGRPVRERRWP